LPRFCQLVNGSCLGEDATPDGLVILPQTGDAVG
jgi:hypothetical protein